MYPSAIWDKHCVYGVRLCVGCHILQLYPFKLSRNLRFLALALVCVLKSALVFTPETHLFSSLSRFGLADLRSRSSSP